LKLKSSRRLASIRWRAAATALVTGFAFCGAFASDSIPTWQQVTVAGSKIENALFRAMPVPGGQVHSRRPPREAKPLLDALAQSNPADAALYSLRALDEEQQLDFAAAENDWKLYAVRAADHTAAQLALADFYHRRARPLDEIAALSVVAKSQAGRDALSAQATEQQPSWLAFERILTIIHDNALGPDAADAQFRDWLDRYPNARQIYSRYFDVLLAQNKFEDALSLIPQYSRQFPQDAVFPVKSRARLEVQRGNIEQGLAIYDREFQPLWPTELIQSYFDVLRQTQSLRKFADQARAAITPDPANLNAAARLFFYYQQQNNSAAALGQLTQFRVRKEASHVAWTSAELYTLARLTYDAHFYAESARYYYALYNTSGGLDPSLDAHANRSTDPCPVALAGLADILITAPDAGIQLGAGNLSFYKDVATADSGPGFLNGILSLLFNSESPRDRYAEEDQKASAYFHREKSAELVELLGKDFPAAPELPPLRARLLEIYAQYGETDTVIREGRRFLGDFPHAPERTAVYLQIADAYARTSQIDQEFATYDELLRELGASRGSRDGSSAPASANNLTAAADYARVLDRYLSRLTAQDKLPQALEVLRIELQRNPDDPAIYERLAQFLEQNRMDAQVEEVYRRAIAQFPERKWYQELARFYLRHQRDQQIDQLTQQVVQIFSGTELEEYFREVGSPGSEQLYLQLNLYANRRFPHDLMFVRNLLGAYTSYPTHDLEAWETLLRAHWSEADDLRNEFFEFLSRTRQLDSELTSLGSVEPDIAVNHWQAAAQSNPAAVTFYAEAELWQSHFEAAAPPLQAIASQFPADSDLGDRAESVYRSLAYFDPRNTEVAVHIAQNLSAAEPTDRDLLARIGDIYADRNLFAKAAPYWNRMAQIEPGKSDAYVSAASVFWDYYDFPNALRILDDGRKKLDDDTLFGYERGAIYENQRDYPHAIAEYVRASLAGANAQATNRLLTLARRPQFRQPIETATRALTDSPNASPEAIQLRIRILEAENRRSEIAPILQAALAKATTFEALSQLEGIAAEHSLESVRDQIFEREAGATADRVTAMQIRYRLAQSYESRKDVTSAQRVIEQLYAANPEILGVVRATVDFYWRNKMQARAIAVLQEAAAQSNPQLKTQFTYEAARKATEARDFATAHKLLEELLQSEPFNAEYVAAAAEIYSHEGDSAGLRDFYLAQIPALQQSSLPQVDRAERIAQLRRGMIPALVRMNDFAGAVDQYIELINYYPEDAGLASEAAIFAGDHTLREKLVSFYSKTVADSPRDSRWAVVLARIDTALENYPGAIDAYAKAVAIRPDRADLRIARADLFERLGKNEEVATEYQKLYDLTYHDSQWMLKLAEIRARQGNADATVAALKAALIDGLPESPSHYFDAAERLDKWNMLEPARAMAEQGISSAGSELLASNQYASGVTTYMRVMARLRKQEDAITAIEKARDAATANASAALIRHAESEGIARVTDAQWRAREIELRRDAATNGMALALKTAGETAAEYFTPEEKARFARFLEQKGASVTRNDLQAIWLPAERAAGFAALEVQWLNRLALTTPANRSPEIHRLVELQDQRLQFVELASQLEAIAANSPRSYGQAALYQAAAAYRTSGDSQAELRVLSSIDSHAFLSREDEQRYFELLLAADPGRLITMAEQRAYRDRRDAIANFALISAPPELALRIVQARAVGEPPVWPKAYLGLAGLYFGDGAEPTDRAFLAALDPKPIGALVGSQTNSTKAVDRDNVLAGAQWFYYGSRYGEFLGAAHRDNFDDFIPAQLEAAPGNAESYVNAAEDYKELGKFDEAIADYEHALELDPQRPLLHDAIALICWDRGDHVRAESEWRAAISILAAQVDAGRVPESFWGDFATVTRHLREHAQNAELMFALKTVLPPYIHRNGNYRDTILLKAAFDALNNPQQFTQLLSELSASAQSPKEFWADAVGARWIPLSQKPQILERIIALAKDSAANASGDDKHQELEELDRWHLRLLETLIDAKRFAEAAQQLAAMNSEARSESGAEESPAPSHSMERIEIAAGLNSFGALLQDFRNGALSAPATPTMIQVAEKLRQLGLRDASRQLLEFAYSQGLESHELTAPNFLGLAEIRLEHHNLKEAVSLLDRMVLVVGEPNTNLDSAAALLGKTGHPAEASIFLKQLAAAQPWNRQAQLRLAQDEIAAKPNASEAINQLRNLASDPTNPYELREEAAIALAGTAPSGDLGSVELNVLSSSVRISAATANQPFFTCERERIASESSDPAQKIALLSAVLKDTPGENAARLPLFFAMIQTKQYRVAIAAFHPILRDQFSELQRPGFQDSAEESESGANQDSDVYSASDGSQVDESDFAGSPHRSVAISREQRARIAEGLAEAHESFGELSEAARLLEIARRTETNPARKQEIAHHLAELHSEISRRAENERRRPVIHDSLDQDRIVRPRISAPASIPALSFQPERNRP
jgi:cellulose synthase operon protein C